MLLLLEIDNAITLDSLELLKVPLTSKSWCVVSNLWNIFSI